MLFRNRASLAGPVSKPQRRAAYCLLLSKCQQHFYLSCCLIQGFSDKTASMLALCLNQPSGQPGLHLGRRLEAVNQALSCVLVALARQVQWNWILIKSRARFENTQISEWPETTHQLLRMPGAALRKLYFTGFSVLSVQPTLSLLASKGRKEWVTLLVWIARLGKQTYIFLFSSELFFFLHELLFRPFSPSL